MIRSSLRWLSDWRNAAAIAASVLVALLAYVTIDASIARNQAVSGRNRSTAAATRRIDKLNHRIEGLGDELVGAADQNGKRIGELVAQISALQEQIRRMGGRPVVLAATTTTTAAPRSTSTTTSSTTTTTTRPRRTCVAGVCIGGN